MGQSSGAMPAVPLHLPGLGATSRGLLTGGSLEPGLEKSCQISGRKSWRGGRRLSGAEGRRELKEQDADNPDDRGRRRERGGGNGEEIDVILVQLKTFRTCPKKHCK